jgi:hypothetical protein
VNYGTPTTASIRIEDFKRKGLVPGMTIYYFIDKNPIACEFIEYVGSEDVRVYAHGWHMIVDSADNFLMKLVETND